MGALPEKEGEKGKNVFSVVDNTGKLIAEYEKFIRLHMAGKVMFMTAGTR